MEKNPQVISETFSADLFEKISINWGISKIGAISAMNKTILSRIIIFLLFEGY